MDGIILQVQARWAEWPPPALRDSMILCSAENAGKSRQVWQCLRRDWNRVNISNPPNLHVFGHVRAEIHFPDWGGEMIRFVRVSVLNKTD